MTPSTPQEPQEPQEPQAPEAAPERSTEVPPRGALALSRHADLKERHTGAILVLPEQAIRLQGSGAEILGLCDGTRDRDAILTTLEARYPDTPELAGELDRFLSEIFAMGGIESSAPGARP